MLSPEMEKVLERYNRGMVLYKEHKWEEALEEFKLAVEIDPSDGPSKLYIERCEHFIENPPPEDWDGVFTMTTK